MAVDKNGFILYKDLIHSVRKLPKETAGELFMHILSYVNDENPETDNLLIELSFEPVKQALKRDLKKYEKTKERNRENANKRWQKPQTIPSDATACDRIPADAKTCEALPLNAKHTDIDKGSDIDIGTDNGNDILLKKETKGNMPSEFFPEEKSETVKSPDSEKEKSSAKKEKEIIDYFHEKCTRLPKILIINQQRKKSINARINDYGIEKIKEVLEIAGKSNFLSGENNKTWTADFDWIMKPTNFVKVLEGNYNNKDHSNGQTNNQKSNNGSGSREINRNKQ
jgi:hypothetical protein